MIITAELLGDRRLKEEEEEEERMLVISISYLFDRATQPQRISLIFPSFCLPWRARLAAAWSVQSSRPLHHR